MGSSERVSADAVFASIHPAAVAPSHASNPRASQMAFAATMMALGIAGLIYGDFALVWQRIPIEHLSGRAFFAYAAAVIELVTGIGLLMKRTARLSSGVLLVFLLLWAVLLKLPAVIFAPQMEATWLGFGEIAVMLAGVWVLFASLVGDRQRGFMRFITGAKGIGTARLLFAVSLPMIGLAHFFYSEQTAALIPAWLPYHLGWAYLTGAGSIAACMGVLLAIAPRLAATLEAVMLWAITLLVWVPAILTTPTDRTPWTAFIISAVIASGAWLVADSYRHVGWLTSGAAARRQPSR
jgi:uncharacterized membrane protein